MTAVNIIKTNDFGKDAGEHIVNSIFESDTSLPVIALPTGNTPLPVYKYLREQHSDLKFHYQALDEYFGLARGDSRLFSKWLEKEILNPLNIPNEHRTNFKSDAENIEKECERMLTEMMQRPLDIAILGIGTNGHIGFNEPPSDKSTSIRVVDLALTTLKSNAEYWGEDNVPTQGITLGLKEILSAEKIILLATGTGKSEILRRSFTGTITPDCPASFLQEHNNFTLIGDENALSWFK